MVCSRIHTPLAVWLVNVFKILVCPIDKKVEEHCPRVFTLISAYVWTMIWMLSLQLKTFLSFIIILLYTYVDTEDRAGLLMQRLHTISKSGTAEWRHHSNSHLKSEVYRTDFERFNQNHIKWAYWTRRYKF